jgi:hypothetical protein
VKHGRLELAGVVAAHLLLSLSLVDWPSLVAAPVGAFAYQLVFRLVLPVVVAGFLWAGQRWAWWALVGLFAVRSIGELSAWVYGVSQPDLGVDSWPVRKAELSAAGYAALAAWVWLSGALRRLSLSSGRKEERLDDEMPDTCRLHGGELFRVTGNRPSVP